MLGPYRFFFYSNEYGGPEHIHVQRDTAAAKIWLNPVALARSRGFAASELTPCTDLWPNIAQHLRERGMSILAVDPDARAIGVQCTDNELVVQMADGRTLSVPLAWFPRLLDSSADARSDFQLIGDGEGIHWPAIDEDISVAGLLAGRPSVQHAKALT